jgi:L-lactate dehydrogenase complex protein LldG
VNARERILARLRAAPATAVDPPDVAGWYAARRREEDPARRAARLREALEAAHAEVHDTTPAGWPDLLLGIAAARGLGSLLVGAGTPHGAVLAARDCGGLRLLPYDRPVEELGFSLFDDVAAGLSLARSAIAATGSLVLWTGPSEPRMLSLVPPVHFVLLDPAHIHADLDAVLRAEHWPDGLPTNALLISGPSKTADIQQTLAYGAHGPRELIVLLVHARAA